MTKKPIYALVKLAKNKCEVLRNEFRNFDNIDFVEQCITSVISMYDESDVKKISGEMQDEFGIGNAIIIHELDNLKLNSLYAVARISDWNKESKEEIVSRLAECPIGDYYIISNLCAVKPNGTVVYGREKNYLKKLNAQKSIKR